MQKFMCIGRVGSNVKYFNNGRVPFATVSIAEHQYYKDKENDERKQITTWIPVVGYGKKADFMRDYLKKGIKVGFSGTWKNSTYEKDGETRYQMVLRIDQVEFCGSKPKTDGDAVEDPFIPEAEMDQPFGDDFEMPSFVPGLDG